MPETLYKCCSPECPGLTWRASDYPHPCKGEPSYRARIDGGGAACLDVVGEYACLGVLCDDDDRGEEVSAESW